MKIGILTFHRAHNYGAVLQTFALQEYLRSKGADVEIIDYRQPYIESIYQCFSFKRCLSKKTFLCLKKIINEFRLYHKRKRRKRHFENFCMKYLHLSDKVAFSKNEIPMDLDIYMHGSDQIWNSKLLGGYDLVYFGGYQTKPMALKASYAASFEDKKINDKGKIAFKKGLSYLDYISVREEKLINRIKSFTNKDIFSVVDPTLLASADIWEPLLHKKHLERYVLTYVVGAKNNINVQNYARSISNHLGLPVLSINEQSPSPEDFVSYIRDADFIISDSFHATVFSILFEKDFFTIASGTSSDVRFTGLLKDLSLDDRIIVEQNRELSFIDYKKRSVESKLNFYRKESILFINQILDNYENNKTY